MQREIIVVGSENPVKINAARLGFERMFPGRTFEAVGVGAASGVSDQPMGDEETLTGARNRAEAAREKKPEGDFWVGLEGGVSSRGNKMDAFAWIVVLSERGECEARTATFELPRRIAELVRSGMELGHADDQVYQRSNSKQKAGAVGLLTAGAIDRTEYYAHAVVLALVAERNAQDY
ncbi:MAG TPA: inosine/xanthosine triphosphatase [Tepidisphaeraceae bacterium]|jgi:inosine/xanthosine triphosphatase